MDTSFLKDIWQLVADYWPHISAVIAAISTAIRAYLRRARSTTNKVGSFFTDTKLLSPPIRRPAYSDRMAYVLSEMSDLAYYKFEGPSDLVNNAVKNLNSLKPPTNARIHNFLETFSADLMSNRHLSLGFLRNILNNSGFQLLDVINVAETQGFVCKRNVGEPYLVLAFRGTEKNVSDWLTDARCVPTAIGKEQKAKVHTGFWTAFTKNKDAKKRTVKEIVEQILQRPEALDGNNKLLPLFITGHSLGGALALLATKLVAPNVTGACYTFGGPRIANYEFFRQIKTPVFRIVNSSDVVPRVPPGAGMFILVGIFKALSWATRFLPVVSTLFDKVEEFLDKLNGYRHYGDLRYLSDVGEGRFCDVRLLFNPPLIDRVVWMWRRLGKSLFVPIKSHNMNIYRKKLKHIANERF